MKKNILGLILTLTLLVAMQRRVNAQYILKEADAQYELFNYEKAIDLYEQAYKKKATLHPAERLAECYSFIHNYKQTESWYAIASGMSGSNIEDHLGYAKALQSNSKYSEAKIEYRKYALLNKAVTPQQLSLWMMSCDSAMVWMKNPGSYIIKNEKTLNSSHSDWGTTVYQDKVVYSSDRGNRKTDIKWKSRPFLKFDGAKVPDKQIYGWTGNRYLRLYSFDSRTDSATLFPLNAGTEYHVGPASFTANGQEMYFTLTRVPHDLQYTKDKPGTINLEIYSSKKEAMSGKWSAPVPFKYNNVNEWSVGDPFITGDGKSLYFASTMPGGKGGTDLYVCFRDGAGEWDKPINLSVINTSGDERSPYFDANNDFYFSSDGYAGMGGLDIFKSANKSGTLGKPCNMGYPVNSPQDDFAYIATSDTSGYLSSDRMDGMGNDDIYSFHKKISVLIFQLAGIVYDKETHAPLTNALVSLSKKNGNRLKVETDENGAFKFNLAAASDYDLTAEKTAFRSDEAKVSTLNLQESTTLHQDLYLATIEIDKAIQLENIYYDFDKWNIRADAAIELDKLVKIMQDNPTIWIELGSHTDSRGNDAYNMTLSQKRAESAVQYIISRGISKNRIEAKGYGETKLLNRCANGVACTIAEHQLNRRTEFKILKQ
jgi:peptidoglycan-associated lipoprotein